MTFALFLKVRLLNSLVVQVLEDELLGPSW